MLPVLIAVISFAGLAFGSPLANHYFDMVLLNTFLNEIHWSNLEPLSLPNFFHEIVDKDTPDKVKGKSVFFNGKMFGLLQSERFGECHGPSYCLGNKFLNCTIAFDKLRVEYDGKLKYGEMPEIDIKGKAKFTGILVYVNVVQKPQGRPFIWDYVFKNYEMPDVNITALGPLNKYTKFAEPGFKGNALGEVIIAFSGEVKSALNRAVSMRPLLN